MPDCSASTCPRPARTGRYLCATCVAALIADLHQLPALVAELDVTEARQDRTCLPTRPSSTVPLGYGSRAADARNHLQGQVREWACHVAQYTGQGAPRSPGRWLLANMDQLTRLPTAGRCRTLIAGAVARATNVIDPPARLFAGPCACGGSLFAAMGDVETRCQHCGMTHRVADRRNRMVAAAYDLAVPAPVAREWVRLLLGVTVDPGTWYVWVHRQKLRAVGEKRWRFGDVVEVVRASPLAGSARHAEQPAVTDIYTTAL